MSARGNPQWACSAEWTRSLIPCGTELGSAHDDQVPIDQSPPHVAHNSGGFTLIASMVRPGRHKSNPVDGLSRGNLEGDWDIIPLKFPVAELKRELRRARRMAPS